MEKAGSSDGTPPAGHRPDKGRSKAGHTCWPLAADQAGHKGRHGRPRQGYAPRVLPWHRQAVLGQTWPNRTRAGWVGSWADTVSTPLTSWTAIGVHRRRSSSWGTMTAALPPPGKGPAGHGPQRVELGGGLPGKFGQAAVATAVKWFQQADLLLVGVQSMPQSSTGMDAWCKVMAGEGRPRCQADSVSQLP